MRDTVKAFKALSDETRLRILNVLLERECCVCEVMQALDISQTRASRNLAALYDAGFLKLKKSVVDKMNSDSPENLTPRTLINSKAITTSMNYFFARGELSQVVVHHEHISRTLFTW